MGLETELGKLVEEYPAGPGIKCLLYKSANNPTVAVHGSILAGTSLEPSGKSGLAELTTRLLIRGTRKLGAVIFFSSRRRHTRLQGDWSSDVCSSDLQADGLARPVWASARGDRALSSRGRGWVDDPARPDG